MVTWFRKPSTGILQLLCFSDSHLLTDKWSFLHRLPLRGYDVTPLCHVQPPFDMFALSSPCPFGYGSSPPATLDGGTTCDCWLHLRSNPDTPFRPTNQCRTIFSAPILLPRPASTSHCGAYLSMLVGLPSQHCLVWFQQLSVTLVYSCPHLRQSHPGSFQTHVHPCVQTTLMSTAICLSNS